MSDDTKEEPRTCIYLQETADYYVAEWKNEKSAGWLVRQTAERTGLSLIETLLFFNFLERLSYSGAMREATTEQRRLNDQTAELRPLQEKILKKLAEEIDVDEDEDWKAG